MIETNTKEFEVCIKGAGIAGQVLGKLLEKKLCNISLVDNSDFPRDKVCGGILQWDSWKFLNSIFHISQDHTIINKISHYWKNKRISTIALDKPMIYVPRFDLDSNLWNQRGLGTNDSNLSSNIINASGVSGKKGEWIGFQCDSSEVDHLEMRYSRGVYVGICPTNKKGISHAAFIIKKEKFDNAKNLNKILKDEFGIPILSRIKGTKRIHYGYQNESLAIGDAMMTTHPYLGLGMKHAIKSAELYASLLIENRAEDYLKFHKKKFMKLNMISQVTALIYNSPFYWTLWPILRYSKLFKFCYQWTHKV